MAELQHYKRQITDYLVEGYGVDNNTIDFGKGGGSRHAKIKFEYNGRTISFPLLNNSETVIAVNITKQEIRRLMGKPAHEPTETPRRNLEDMTRNLEDTLGSLPVSSLIANSIENMVVSAKHLARVALYGSNKLLNIVLPDAVVAPFMEAPGPRGIELAWFETPDTWVIRHRLNDQSPLKRDTRGWLATLGGTSTWEKLGAFGMTKAVCWLEGGKIIVKLSEMPNKTAQRAKKASEPIEVLPVEELQPTVVETAPFIPTPVIDPTPTEDELRCLLESIRMIEAKSDFRLTRDETGWIFRAVRIVR